MSDEDKATDPLIEILSKVRSIDSRLSSLETKVDERLRETRPIWEGVVAELAEVKKEQKLTNHKLDRVILDIANVRAELEEVGHQVDHLSTVDPHATTERIK